MADLRSVDERLTQTVGVDHTRAFELCRDGMGALADKVFAAFDLHKHPSSEPFEDYGDAAGRMRGSLGAYRGKEIDWAIWSWIGSPDRGFSNHHLTLWLPPTCKVPHLGLAIGTIPQLFFFLDLVPRSDLWVSLDELDTYHEALNKQFLRVRGEKRFGPFISQNTYIRQAISPVGLCLDAEPNEQNITDLLAVAGQTVDRWIGWVKEAPPTPERERPALAQRDEFVRRTVCERDPANIVAEKVLGADMTHALVRVMWGADRS